MRAPVAIDTTPENGAFTLRTGTLRTSPLRIGPLRIGEAPGPYRLEMVGVPEAALRAARITLALVADLVSEVAPGPNENVGVHLARSLLVVSLLEPRASDGQRILRVGSPDSDAREDEPPWSAIGSVLLDEAGSAVARGDLAAAERVLRESLGLFSGDPARARLDGLGPEYNRENALAYDMLALDVGPADAPTLFVAGLKRNPYAAFVEVGGAPGALAEPSYIHLAELARFIAYQTLREVDEVGACTRSPIWYLDPEGRVARSAPSWPPDYGALYFRGEPARALADEWSIATIVDAIAKRRHEPLAIFERTFATRVLWREPPGARLEVTNKPFVSPSRLLSLMLAHVGHGVRAGLSRDEIRACLGADDAPELRARATQRLEAFEPTVRGWKKEAEP